MPGQSAALPQNRCAIPDTVPPDRIVQECRADREVIRVGSAGRAQLADNPGVQLGLLAAAVGGRHARCQAGQHRRELR